MRRVPDSNYPVRDLFGKGKHGFGPGDKTNGTIATIPGAAFMNAVQEEICNVIEHANLKLEEGAYDQLFMAIKKTPFGVECCLFFYLILSLFLYFYYITI